MVNRRGQVMRLEDGETGRMDELHIFNRQACMMEPAQPPSSGDTAQDVSATGSPGTMIHAAPAGGQFIDIVELSIINTNALSVLASIEVGGLTIPVSLSPSVSFPAKIALVNGNSLRVFGAIASALKVFSFVRRVARTA